MTKIKPMLAHKYNPDKADYPAYIQPKLDGVRCIIQCEYDNVVSANVIRAYSRTGKEFMNVKHIKESLRGVFLENPNLILDGELYNHGLKHDFLILQIAENLSKSTQTRLKHFAL